jgi:hypothetical protein
MLIDFSKEKFDIIIQAGQSNSEGCGFGDIDNPFVPDDRIWYLNGDLSATTNCYITKASEAVWENNVICNFALPFAKLYVENELLQKSRKLLIVRAGVSATGFLDGRWRCPDAELYRRMMKMTETALSLNGENRLAAFLWHQGESDAGLNATYEVHYENLITLVKSVKSTFKCGDLPFIAGDFVQDWKGDNMAVCEPVVKAIRAVCVDLGVAGFVETDGLTSNAQVNGGDDTIHFSRQALMILGRRYFEKYQKLIHR